MKKPTGPKARLALAMSLLLAISACGSATEADDAVTTIASSAVSTVETTIESESTSTADGSDADANSEAATAESAEPQFELKGDGELPIDQAEVNSLVAFVEDETGRDFQRPPVVVVQNAETFAAGLLPADQAEEDEARAEADLLAHTYRALDLGDQSGPELFDDITAFATSPEGIGGYYDPETDELYVPADFDSSSEAEIDGFRSLLVHELTHALDGQYADLSLLLENVEDAADPFLDEVFADRAVVEGRATAVQLRFNIAEAITPESPDLDFDVPNAYVLTLVQPYQSGAQWVEGQGGPAETWDAVGQAPATSESMLFGRPDDEAITVEAPSIDGTVLAEGSIGATGLFLWLTGDNLIPGPELGPAIEAADGWGGDAYVLWSDDTQSCVAVNIVGDEQTDTDEIEAAFSAWADIEPDNGGSRGVEVGSEFLTITSCGPAAS